MIKNFYNILKTKVNMENPIFVFLLCIVMFQLPAIINNKILNEIFLILKFLIYIYLLISYFKYIKKFDFSKIALLAIIYYMIMIAATFFNDGMLNSVMRQGIEFVFVCIFIDLLLKENINIFFEAVLPFFEIVVFLNLLSVIIFPDGLYASEYSYYGSYFLLGYDNQMINYILPAIIISLINYTIYKNKKNLWRLISILICSLATELWVWSGMSLLIVCACIIFTIITQTKFVNFTKIHNIIVYMGCYVLLWYGIVIARLQEHFEYIIVNILKKPITLSMRTVIWERGIALIKKKPWLGYGKEEYAKRAIKLGFKENAPAGLHMHNRILEILYRGGIPMLLVFILMLTYSGKKLWDMRKSIIAKILCFGIFIYMFGMITEYYDYSFFFFGFMVMAENIKILANTHEQYITMVVSS